MREKVIVFRASSSSAPCSDNTEILILMKTILKTDNDIRLNQALQQNCVNKVSLLNLVCKLGKIKCLRLLLNSGTNPNKTHLKKTPLMWACTGITMRHVQCAQELIAKGEHIFNHVLPLTKNNNHARSAVTVCCIEGNTTCLSLLVDAGAELNEPKSATPLYLCCVYDFDEGVKLLRQTALVDVKNDDGTTPLMAACEKGNARNVQLLVEAKASTEEVSQDDMTALSIACRHGYEPCVKALIEGGAKLDAEDEDGLTGLIIACMKGHTGCASLLIEHGADVNHRTSIGDNALMLAAVDGHTDIVKVLIEKNVELNVVNILNQTALILATHNGHTSVVEDMISTKELSEENMTSALRLALEAKNWKIANLLQDARRQDDIKSFVPKIQYNEYSEPLLPSELDDYLKMENSEPILPSELDDHLNDMFVGDGPKTAPGGGAR